MEIPFFKYHGTGNDFILVDNRQGLLSGEENEWFATICHRRFGIGADGVILLNANPFVDFEMDYFNSDGNRSSMCGNGGRCIAQFARDIGLASNEVRFIAPDGPHHAYIGDGVVHLQMSDPEGYRHIQAKDFWVNTGSPHFVRLLTESIDTIDVVGIGRQLRSAEPWGKAGTNVNFAQVVGPGRANVRTYERGVEDETYSCGTGVTAVAEVLRQTQPSCPSTVTISTPGGVLAVQFVQDEAPWLIGPAQFVFRGVLTFPKNA